jgi:hypothetical protein
MASRFRQLEKRVLLRKRLSDSGFEVRMHSYDYFVIKEKFVSIISLEPEFNKASIKKISWNLKGSVSAIDKIYKIVKEIDPQITIEIRE